MIAQHDTSCANAAASRAHEHRFEELFAYDLIIGGLLCRGNPPFDTEGVVVILTSQLPFQIFDFSCVGQIAGEVLLHVEDATVDLLELHF